MSIPEQQTLNLKIKEVALADKGVKAMLEVPWSQYPMAVLVPQTHSLASKIKPGGVWTWTLWRGNMRRGKDGGLPDGTKEYHYWWNFANVREVGTEPQPAPTTAPQAQDPATPATAPRRAILSATDLRDRSIERQVSAKNRTELAIACLQIADRQGPPNLDWASKVALARQAYDEFAAVAEVRDEDAEAGDEPDTSADDLPF